MIELHDIDQFVSAPARNGPEDMLAGYVHFLPNGGWHAFRISTNYERSGDGPLRDLEPGLWVTNLPWEKVTAAAAGNTHVLLRSDGWLKLGAAQILAAFGLDDVNVRIAARHLATVVHRVHKLALEVVHHHNPEPRHFARVKAAIRSKPSLASGLLQAIDGEIALGKPSEKMIASVFSQAYQLGLFCYGRKVAPEAHFNLSFRFPSLSHALAITQDPVPKLSTWRKGVRSEKMSSSEFVEEARMMGRPIIFMAAYSRDGREGEVVDAFVGSNRSSGTYRSMFLPEEVEILGSRVEMSAETVLVGGEWEASKTSALLRSLVEVCGGRQVASHSWSANLLAENILSSSFRRLASDETQPASESIWLAARDRCAMLPAIEAFYGFGASLVGAQHGVITIQCPSDPELLSGVMDTAWQFGLTLPMSDIARIKALGVPIPSERAGFGGNPVDYGYSVVAQLAKKKALSALDEVMDAPEKERAGRFRSILD